MSRRKPDQDECMERRAGPARVAHWQNSAGSEGHKESSKSFRSFVLRIASVAILYALAFAGWGTEMARAQVSDAETASYADALTYCRGSVPRPMALRSDKRVLCLDGQILEVSDLLLASGLENSGLFVVRSHGGDIATA